MTISAFTRYNMTDIPEALRLLANHIEHDGLESSRVVVVIESPEGMVKYRAFGAEPFTQAHALGMCYSVANMLCARGEE